MPPEKKKEKKKGSRKASSSGSAEGPLVPLRPSEILYTYSKVLPYFSGCGRTLKGTLAEIESGAIKASDLPAIAVIAAEMPVKGEDKKTDARDDDGWSSDEDARGKRAARGKRETRRRRRRRRQRPKTTERREGDQVLQHEQPSAVGAEALRSSRSVGSGGQDRRASAAAGRRQTHGGEGHAEFSRVERAARRGEDSGCRGARQKRRYWRRTSGRRKSFARSETDDEDDAALPRSRANAGDAIAVERLTEAVEDFPSAVAAVSLNGTENKHRNCRNRIDVCAPRPPAFAGRLEMSVFVSSSRGSPRGSARAPLATVSLQRARAPTRRHGEDHGTSPRARFRASPRFPAPSRAASATPAIDAHPLGVSASQIPPRRRRTRRRKTGRTRTRRTCRRTSTRR